MATAVGVIFSSMHEENIPELSRSRTMASVPFGGRYRMIDFALSNMVNAGITTVGLVTKKNYQSLIDHIGSGKDWDLARKDGGIVLLPPFSDENEGVINTRLEALKGVTGFLARRKEEYVVLSDCDGVAKIDLREIIAYHEEKGADITMVTHNQEIVETPYYMVLESDETGRIKEVKINPKKKGRDNVYINIMIINRELLLRLVTEAISLGYSSFGKDILIKNVNSMKLYTYDFKGYFAGMDSMATYYKENMELLNKEVRDELFGTREIYTKVKDSAPSKYGDNAIVENSLISDGCNIEGTVINSILFRGVKVAKGAVVQNCIIMQDSIVGQDAKINCVITDKNVVIRDRRNLSGCEELPYFIQKGTML